MKEEQAFSFQQDKGVNNNEGKVQTKKGRDVDPGLFLFDSPEK